VTTADCSQSWSSEDVKRRTVVDCVSNVTAHAQQKPDFVFRLNGRVHLNRRGASVQSTTGGRGVRISGSNAGYTMFRGSVKVTGYPLHSPVSPSLPPPSRASPCAISLQLESNCCHVEYFTSFSLYGAAYGWRKPFPTLG